MSEIPAMAADRHQLNERLPTVVDALVKSIHAETKMHHVDRVLLPNREAIVAALGLLRQLVFPGYFGQQGLTKNNLSYRIGELVMELTEILYEQVRCCLRYKRQSASGEPLDEQCEPCDRDAVRIVAEFFDRLPAVRQMLASDVQAAFDGDPAAQTTDETIFSYPGIIAISIQRLAHEFHRFEVPLLPRIMTEHAHSLTGIDIHPGAQLGQRFFIDHGTGIVIGETVVIGNDVKIYQGVTLGALAPAFGQLLRGTKRHPTIEDNVTIYAGATILGGDTVIGKGCTIGGNVFITTSVPEYNQVTSDPPTLKYRDRRSRKRADFVPDFQI